MATSPVALGKREIDVIHSSGAALAQSSRELAAGSSGISARALAALVGALPALVLLLPGAGMAHEPWFLTPEHMVELNALPRPELFTRISATNIGMLAAATLAVVGWLLLATSRATGRFSGIAAKVAARERHAPLAVRVCLALTLTMAALGLQPRHGTHLLQAATLGFPDLELQLLGAGWGWLGALELALAAALLVGFYTRVAAIGVLLLTVIGIGLFGTAMLAYAGAMAGAALYLALRGGGSRCLAPAWAGAEQLMAHLDRQAPGLALFSVRALTGATFLWAGIYYKLLQPNLVLAIIVEGGLPTFGLGAEVFVLGMTLVEISAGALMMAGVMVRPMALALFVPFLFLSTALGESPIGHVLFYGNLFALATGGAGSWRPAPLGSAEQHIGEPLEPALELAGPAGQR